MSTFEQSKTYEEQYDDINHKIDRNMKLQESIRKRISAFEATYGYVNPELDSEFQSLVDGMDLLLAKCHEISNKMEEGDAMKGVGAITVTLNVKFDREMCINLSKMDPDDAKNTLRVMLLKVMSMSDMDPILSYIVEETSATNYLYSRNSNP